MVFLKSKSLLLIILLIIDDFYLQVHYNGTDIQNNSIKCVLSQKKKAVYATELMSGAIIVDNGNLKTVGKVKKFVYE